VGDHGFQRSLHTAIWRGAQLARQVASEPGKSTDSQLVFKEAV